jgi:hypothetical protein
LIKYCGKECQKNDYSNHKKYCDELKKINIYIKNKECVEIKFKNYNNSNNEDSNNEDSDNEDLDNEDSNNENSDNTDSDNEDSDNTDSDSNNEDLDNMSLLQLPDSKIKMYNEDVTCSDDEF